MSFKKSKLDLLVRVRYRNPLPAPPCPPKLLDIPTDPGRYARAEFTDAIAHDTPFPMVIDAELGMPLDLGQWDSLWHEDGDPSALNPDPDNLPKLDPADEFLLEDPASGGRYTNGSGTPSSSLPPPSNVGWLRKTEYGSREVRQVIPATPRPRDSAHAPIDISRGAQIRHIESSFAAAAAGDGALGQLRHPNKPGVHALEALELLPDADIWANTYDLFRFSERPGDRPADADDLRLDCAILRPMESDGEHFLAYYLTKDDESAMEFKRRRMDGTSGEAEATPFQFMRDYELRKIEREVPNEFLLVLEDGEAEEDVFADVKPARRAKGAYYKNLERKMMLKRKQKNIHEEYADKWEVVRVSHTQTSLEEEDERRDVAAEVLDPGYMNRLMDRDAEGEIDDGEAHLNGHPVVVT